MEDLNYGINGDDVELIVLKRRGAIYSTQPGILNTVSRDNGHLMDILALKRL
jgi:hypothetical protein